MTDETGKTTDGEGGLARIRAPFPSHQISKLPKPTKAQTKEVSDDFRKGIRCKLCGGWHHKNVVHLDYVGHAALTDRLLDCDPMWNWEPVSFAPDGTPLRDQNGGMWIRLTICGHTRLGYGHAEGKSGGDAIKEVIGDALRNAAMRFGAALDLWHKGELHASGAGEDPAPAQKVSPEDAEILGDLAQRAGTNRAAVFAKLSLKGDSWADTPADQFTFFQKSMQDKIDSMAMESEGAEQ